MLLLQPIADRIAGLVTDLRKMVPAANLATAKDDLKTPPAGYLLWLTGNAQPNMELGMSVEQYVPEQFALLLAVDSRRDVRGDAVFAALKPLRDASIQALLGYQPDAGYDPIQLGTESLLDLDVTTLWWQIIFKTGYYERKV